MKLRNIRQIRNLSGKRVLLRLDLNVPLSGSGQVESSGAWRLQRAVPTIKFLLSKQARVIIVAHLGRPQGKTVPALSLLSVSQYLAKLLKKPIEFWADDFSQYEQDSLQMKKASVAMLENIRFYEREKKNCRRLALRLSKLADIYINDAFGNLHRRDSSMLAITENLPSFAGLLVEDEVKHLESVIKAKSGLAVIFGGAKVATKIKLIKKMSDKAQVLLGGALSSTIFKAQGLAIGKSLVDNKVLAVAKRLQSKNIHLPLDVAVASSPKAKKYKVVTVDNIAKQQMILDIGPATVKEYLNILAKQKIIIWNGPLGFFENKNFVKGSKDIMMALAKSKATTIIGGGETVELVNQLKLHDKFNFLSTGGGAMLSFLEGAKLPALEKLKIK